MSTVRIRGQVFLFETFYRLPIRQSFDGSRHRWRFGIWGRRWSVAEDLQTGQLVRIRTERDALADGYPMSDLYRWPEPSPIDPANSVVRDGMFVNPDAGICARVRGARIHFLLPTGNKRKRFKHVRVDHASGKWELGWTGERLLGSDFVRMHREEASQYAKQFEACVRCGRAISATRSVDRCIGPTCWGHTEDWA